MSQFAPFTSTRAGVLSIRFTESDGVRAMDVDCVVDLTDFGDVVGVEILDLRRQLSGGTIEGSPTGSKIRWSYDDEIDAFYVRLSDGRGQAQRGATCTAHVDSARRVVQLDVPVASGG